MTDLAPRWPRVEAVVQRWEPTATIGRDSGRRYEASMPAVATLTPALDVETLELARSATIALTRFDAELGGSIEAFAPLLLRTEAASSSRIEMLTASARSILTAEAGARSGRNAEAIVANTIAMTAALELSSDIGAASMLRMHAVLMQGLERHRPGRWRKEPVWIGTRSDSPIGADYVAPPWDEVPRLIDDLVVFCRRDDLDPLVQVAIAHAQFESIHPFTDGNGRTGRALAQSMLRRSGVTRAVAVPVSAGLLADVAGYHAALDSYRSGEVAPIVRSFALASARAIENARQLIDEIGQTRLAWEDRLIARRSSNAWRLLDVFARRPVLSAAHAARELGVQAPNVYPPLRLLESAGIVQAKNEPGAGPLWRSDEILHALDRFADRAGRRSR